MKKEDKRTRKTIKAIQDALLKLLAEKSLSAIKIIELCAQADINRTTFYLHFENTGDVLRSIREEIVERIFAKYSDVSFLYTFEHPLGFLTACTEIISSYEGFERFVRVSAEASEFLDALKAAFTARVYAEYKNVNPLCDEYAFFIIDFITAGTFDTYIVWLRSEKTVSLSSLFDHCGKIFAAGHEALTAGKKR